MQKTRCIRSVEIDQVAICNDAQPRKIEMRIKRSQRVECPRHFVDPLCKHKITLCMLQLVPNVEIPILRLYSKHMRVVRGSPVFVADKAVYKADQVIVIKRTDQHAAGRFSGDKLS